MRNIINIDTFFKDPNKAKLEMLAQKDNEEKAKYLELKDSLVQEAAEKEVLRMMESFDDQVETPEKLKRRKFTEPLKVSALHSLPSHPNQISLSETNCTSEVEVERFFKDTAGLKMLFIKGDLYKTNVQLQDNEFEYYRLIGEAYNTRLLERNVSSKSQI
jgi:hypothetical protein